MSNTEFKPVFSFSTHSSDLSTKLIVVPSGYLGQFHVIVEYGAESRWNTYFLNKSQIFERWGVEVPDVSLSKLVKEEANDMTLGAIIRRLLGIGTK